MGYHAIGHGQGPGPMMKVENMEAALERFKSVMLEESFFERNAKGGSFAGGKCVERWYSWTDTNTLRNATSIIDVLEEFGFHCQTDADGNLMLMDYDSKVGQEDILLEVLAPYWEPGSNIEWRGEDGSLWENDLAEGTVREGRVVYR